MSEHDGSTGPHAFAADYAPSADRRAAVARAIAGVVARAPTAILLGYGSFFRHRGERPWGDVDLTVLTPGADALRKQRTVAEGEMLDVTWCGLDAVAPALHARAASGRQDLAQALATGVPLRGDADAAGAARRLARAIIDAGPLPLAAPLVDRLRLRLTARGDDRTRMTVEQRVTACLEDYEPVIALASLRRGQWITPRAYEDLWSDGMRRFAAEAERALRAALAGDDVPWCDLVRCEVMHAGGPLRCWP